MRNGSVFRLQGPVRLNGDGSLLFCVFFLPAVVCVASDDTALNMIFGWLNQYSKEMCSGLNFSSITRRGSGLQAHTHVPVHAQPPQGAVAHNKGQGWRVCLQYASKMGSSGGNACLHRGFPDHLNLVKKKKKKNQKSLPLSVMTD